MIPKKTKIILDTNLWISFLLSRNFNNLDNLIFEKNVQLIFSDELVNEFIEVAQRPKFRRFFSNNDVLELLECIGEYSDFIEVRSSVQLCRDEKDNFLLNLAIDSRADYLVTGDKDLLTLESIERTKIISISDLFLEI